MTKLLVTGATGFIGSYVVESLLEKGINVVATSSDRNKASSKLWFSKVNYKELNLKLFDPSVNYFHFFEEPDGIIHLAWEGLPNYNSEFHIEENLPRHFLFIKNLLDNGIRNITITGTCLEYGMMEGQLSEEMACVPSNPYAIAKYELWRQLMSLNLDVNLKWIRLFYMYGKGQNPNSLISQLEKAIETNASIFNMSGGEQLRDFLPVEKVAEYIVAIALQNKITGIINCCSGKPIKIKDFVSDYLKSMNKNIKLNLGYYPYPNYEPMNFWGNESKLKSVLANL
ncbi:MAG: NAD-dependent epimerase/dehydratase family protein [Ferruginibacter sp.]|nr:NAD-dependent epimerase/dehydratase family protein [Ferruginibacter sp.]